MHSGEAACCEGSRGDIIHSAPCSALQREPAAGKPVNCGKREVLSLAVVPSQTYESAEIRMNLLFQVHPRSILERTKATHSRHIRRGSGLLRHPDRVGIAAGV